MWSGVRRGAFMALCVTMLTAGPAATQGPSQITALSKLQPGRWELRDIGDPRVQPPRSICLTDARILTQIQHRASPCSRMVIANEEDRATVHYTCPSSGFGRTTIRVESGRLVRIDTQGIYGNLPFDRQIEARRVGGCPRRR